MSTHRRTAPTTEAEDPPPETTAWLRAIRLAIEKHDPSLLALYLTRGRRVPLELQDDVYRIVVSAPWRDAKPRGGPPRKLTGVDENGIISLYSWLAGGILRPHGRRQTRQAIVDNLANSYGVSANTIERVLAKSGRTLPKPPRVVRTKTRR